jgi:hypothetical protein
MTSVLLNFGQGARRKLDGPTAFDYTGHSRDAKKVVSGRWSVVSERQFTCSFNFNPDAAKPPDTQTLTPTTGH